MPKPELKLSVFSDYICPFCYIGHHRIQQLKADYELKINWCFIEIHPETPEIGMPTSELNYNDEQWQSIINSLNNLLEEDQLAFHHQHQFTTNSHKALLLAEACKPLGAEAFYKIHNRLFEAFFVDMLNIGDVGVLRTIAKECGIDNELVERALNQDEKLENNLKTYLQYAQKSAVSGVPTVFIGKQKLTGVSSVNSLKKAAEEFLNHAVL